MRIDYIHSAPTAAAESRRAKDVSRAARKVTRDPRSALHVARFRLLDTEAGFVNRARDPGYRVFLSHGDLEVLNYSNDFRTGDAKFKLSGKFMGTGAARASGTLRKESSGGPDFDLDAAIEDTPVTALNDLFRSYGKFDVAAGIFSFYTELKVARGHIDGYVKPLFRDMKVYDGRQDAEKSVFKKLYEKIVGGVAGLAREPEDRRGRHQGRHLGSGRERRREHAAGDRAAHRERILPRDPPGVRGAGHAGAALRSRPWSSSRP